MDNLDVNALTGVEIFGNCVNCGKGPLIRLPIPTSDGWNVCSQECKEDWEQD